MSYNKPIKCPTCQIEGNGISFKRGYYYTKHNHDYWNPRYTCYNCGARFSSHSDRANKGQKKPEMNAEIFQWICSGLTMNQISENFKIHKRTIQRKIKWLSEQAIIVHQKALASNELKAAQVQLYEIEAYEHTPLKPLSVIVAINAKTSQILDMRVATRCAPERLLEASIAKYGKRIDTRMSVVADMVKSIAMVLDSDATVTCEAETVLATAIRSILNESVVVEVAVSIDSSNVRKKDPLFAVKALCNSLKTDIAVLGPRNMAALKSAETLQDLLNIYIAFNNRYDITTFSRKA